MGRSEYIRVCIMIIPPDIIAQYKLNERISQYVWIYMEIIQGMFGLPQAIILANNLLVQRLDNSWENTDGIQKGGPPSSAPNNGEPPFQCSPESDHDFHVEPTSYT